MMSILYLYLFFIILSSLILMINFLISFKMFKSREMISPFECGFDPILNSRLPFSIQFFLISLIFLIFDIELTLLIPLIFMMFFLNKFMIFSSLFFMLILISGLMIEYTEQSIDWKD